MPPWHGGPSRFNLGAVEMPFYISPLWCGDFIAARQSCRWVGRLDGYGRVTLLALVWTLCHWEPTQLDKWSLECLPQTIFLNFENEVIEATKAVISVLHRPMCPISRTPTTNTNSSGPPKKENVREATAFFISTVFFFNSLTCSVRRTGPSHINSYSVCCNPAPEKTNPGFLDNQQVFCPT